jgi:hypothetical protein
LIYGLAVAPWLALKTPATDIQQGGANTHPEWRAEVAAQLTAILSAMDKAAAEK